ncbi:SDR family oxidoreductase [Synechococcus sp. CC9616]|uniref:dTDP-4-dehydrorhamnose reductase family protein n=1 Tax=Synechococcus sp. CC9616 TaxID=110663 RepID=UPI000A00A4DC|nr:SDR family oxidoreductase [Synechococcus sp. CC9616]
MFRKIIVLGARGMAGQAFYKYFKERDLDVLGVSRNGPDLNLNLVTEYDFLEDIFCSFKPCIVVNCVALVSLQACEDNPILSYQVNSLLPSKLASSSRRHNFLFLHISTDHYYLLDDVPSLHSEIDPIILINSYAKSKYLGELYASLCDRSLIIRTNITGFRNSVHRPTFIEWMIDSLQTSASIQLFTDFYTSTIDVSTFCCFVYSLAQIGCSGLFNIASSRSISKFKFASLLAKEMKVDLSGASEASVQGLHPARASDLGLDCCKAEAILGLVMPSPEEVVCSLWRQYDLL